MIDMQVAAWLIQFSRSVPTQGTSWLLPSTAHSMLILPSRRQEYG